MIELPDLDALPQSAVDDAHAYLTQRLAEYSPSAESRRGIIHDVVLYLESVFAAASDEWADRLRKSGTLLAIQADPTLATDEIVDGVLSNFGAVRRPGEAASGRVVIQIASLAPSNVAAGTVFESQGQSFTTESAFSGRTTQAAVITATDRLIRPVGDGTYFYVIDVVAVDVGASGMLRRGTALLPQAIIPGLVSAYAESDFTGGLNAESNTELVARQQEGIAGKNVSNRVTVSAMIRQEPAFENVLGVSTIGFGDPEQTRYHSLFPVAFGGRLDVYARTQALPQDVRVEVTATLIEHTLGLGATWQFGLDRFEAPGFYDVPLVVRSGNAEIGSSGYEVTEIARTPDLSGVDDYAPDLTSAAEAAFTPYQAATVRFFDTDTDASLPIGTERDYVAYVRAMPLLADLQEFLAGRDRRPASSDVVVKAPVPCDVRLTLVVYKRPGQADPDTAAMASALAAEVNRTAFPGRLAASSMLSVAHDFLADGMTVGAPDLWGTILVPDGGKLYLRDRSALVVPDLPSRGVSGRTVGFFLEPTDVSISVTTVGDAAV